MFKASFDDDPLPREREQRVCLPVEVFETRHEAFAEHEKLQIREHFRALVRGRDARAQRFEVETVLNSLSHNRVSLRLSRPVELGSSLFVVSRVAGARIALLVVARIIELDVEGRYEVTAAIRRYRFLRLAEAVGTDPATQTPPAFARSEE